MPEQREGVRKVPVRDKRRTAREEASRVAEETPGVVARDGQGQVLMEESSDVEQTPVPKLVEDPGAIRDAAPEISVEELQRLKADLENDRKRMVREQNRALDYATRDLVKRFIPVIDHLRLAIEHGEGGNGVELALKELLDILGAQGLHGIDVHEGDRFDPTVHHALSSRVDPEVEVDTVVAIHRPGFRFKDQVVRSAEVVVAQPAEVADKVDDEDEEV
ncbi:MAG: nucleotide exchange factor GrpE [Actinomycetota bacterium]|nr:nucleotide exchange factor GrpE [Actinomycetota bacterium]